MKQQANQLGWQLNLPLFNPTPLELPLDKQRELALALAEMLLDVASEIVTSRPTGGEDESENHR
jgi:hypothetical protein